jgi:hypothetical protein
MKVGGRRRIVEKNRSKKGVEKNKKNSVEYFVGYCKVIVPFIIIFGMCRKENI